MSGVHDDTIHKAVERCDLEAVRRFLEVEGVDVDCRDKHGHTPLIIAVMAEGKDTPATSAVVSYLISKNANVEVASGGNFAPRTVLMIASYRGKLQVVTMLLEEGHANVNKSIPGSGQTALY